MTSPHEKFRPLFTREAYSPEEETLLRPFFTNLDKSVYALLIPSPELAGALCSRMSRAKDDIRGIFLREFVKPFLSQERIGNETDDVMNERLRYGEELRALIQFLNEHPFTVLFANPRARNFFLRWLAEYGDDSIAQMAGMHLAFSSLSQVAIKHIEDMRIGLAPIEKSTRYVDYSQKVDGHYLYYTDPTLKDLELFEEYETAMDGLFDTYKELVPKLAGILQTKFPDVPAGVVEKKAFDCLRGLLPMATFSQVSFFGNGQAFEYMIARSLKHPLGEIRWAGESAYEELSQIGPSFFRRLKDSEKKETAEAYQEYLALRKDRMAPLLSKDGEHITKGERMSVRLVESDKDGEVRVITGMLYEAAGSHNTWEELEGEVKNMNEEKKKTIIETYLKGRTQRWQRIGRAFEHASALFEIDMNIGGWRDLHRHRMLTHQRQFYSCHHGYDTPPEIVDAGLLPQFSKALEGARTIFEKIEKKNPHLAQYAVPLAYRVRFLQRENLRQSFWQIELRTGPQGHPDYRHVEQEKYKLLLKAYPLLAPYMLVDLNEYDFARRETEKRIEKKAKELGV